MKTLFHQMWLTLGVVKTTLAITIVAAILSFAIFSGVHVTFGGATLRGLVLSIVIPCAITPIVSYFFIMLVVQLEKTKQELSEREKKYLFLADTITDIVWTMDLDLKTTYVSPSVEKTLGFTPEERYLQNVEEMITPESLDRSQKVLLRFIQQDENGTITQQFRTIDIEYYTKSGSTVWMENNVQFTRDSNNNITGLLGVSRDISGRKLAENRLKRSEEKYRTMMESMIDGVYICSPDYRIEYMNPAMIRNSGRDATGEICFNAIHGRDASCQDCLLPKILEGQKINQEINRKNKTYLVSHSPVSHDNGSVSKLSIYRDISAQRQMESQIQQTQKMESIGKLAGGIAHDFNNILYPIIGFTQLSQNELPEDHPIQENLTDILNGAKRARNLVKRILLYSRQKEHQLEPMTLQPIIKESYKLLRSSIPTNIELILDLYNGEDFVLCDATEIHEIILNLCTNSYHAITENDGKIVISLKKQNPVSDEDLPSNEYLRLSVKDNGVGIPEKIRDIIFDPYVTTKDIGKGSGLGLSVVYGIVEAYKGIIHLESNSVQGTEMIIFLPISTKRTDVSKVREKKPLNLKGKERILFVDDEKSIVKLIVRTLERHGYDITGKQDSTDALKLIESNPYKFDLIISDMAMPKMEGLQLAENIFKINPDVPVLICSGYSDKLDRTTFELSNIKAKLDKPILVEALLKKIREIFDQSKGKDEKNTNN